MNDLKLIAKIFSSRWHALWSGWMVRNEVLNLVNETEAFRSKLRSLQDELHRKELEIEQLKGRLEKHEAANQKHQHHIHKLWGFISLRHRLDSPPKNGTIRHILQQAQERR